MKKRIAIGTLGVLLLLLTIAVTQIPGYQADAASASDFVMDGTTLVKYEGTASAVSVPVSVKSIGEEAFAGNTGIYSVTLPKGLISIGYGAFRDCERLSRITIPDSVTELGNGVFKGCTALKKVFMGTDLAKLGSGVFAGCDVLTDIVIDKDNQKFVCDKGVIYNKEKTCIYQVLSGRKETNYVMPTTVEEVKEYSFWGCKNLESVSLGSSMAAIPGYAFSNCQSLQTVTIPYTVKRIDMRAFEDCASLQKVILPSSITNIHETAFDGCSSLTLQGETGTYAGTYADTWNELQKEFVIQAEYEDSGAYKEKQPVIEDQDSQNQVDADKEENKTNINQPQGEDNRENVLGTSHIVGNQAVMFLDNTKLEVTDFGNIPGNADKKQETQQKAYDVLPKYTIADKHVIADQAFYQNDALQRYNIPDGITEIGEFAFARSGLTEIVIPDGITEIAYGAFYKCDKLNKIIIPETVQNIEPEAFAHTGWMKHWLAQERTEEPDGDFLIVGDGIALAYRGTGSIVEFPDEVKQIGPYAFTGHKEIQKVILPASVTVIGEGAFKGCDHLQEVTGGEGLKQIKDGAFSGCPIQNIRIPASVEELGLGAYDLTGTGKPEDEKIILFEGRVLPTVSYERTATRLSNQEARKLALQDVVFAVIDGSFNSHMLENSVLADRKSGFKGIVCSINHGSQTATCEYTTLHENELEGMKLPSTILVNGKKYELTNVEQLKEKTVGRTDDKKEELEGIQITCHSETLQADFIQAAFQNEMGGYELSVSDSSEAGEAIGKAYEALYGTDIGERVEGYQIELTEAATGIPISKTGSQELSLTLPVKAGMQEGDVQILCLDRNGQVEQLPCELSEREGQTWITFLTNHFSAYGIYYVHKENCYGEGRIQNGKVVISF